MRTLALVSLLASATACDSATPAKKDREADTAASMQSAEIKRALVLDAAIARLEGEIAALESTPAADAALLAEKRELLAGLRVTLANTRRRIEELEAATQPGSRTK